jgi:polar amino acid transport system ATP-binding protein
MIASAISLRGLRKSFGKHAVLKGVDLDLPAGRLSAILGRSGSGKSTLLRCLGGLERPDGGEYTVRGRCGMVFQQFHLFPHLDILANLCLAPRVAQGRSAAETREQALALLARMGLDFHAHHYPSQLSGGQQQRVAIARALMTGPEILLFDEPTSSLDPQLAEEVLEVMVDLKRRGMTQVLVTHEHAFARRYADWVVVMEDGAVLEQGRPNRIFQKPKDPRTRAFLRSQG